MAVVPSLRHPTGTACADGLVARSSAKMGRRDGVGSPSAVQSHDTRSPMGIGIGVGLALPGRVVLANQ